MTKNLRLNLKSHWYNLIEQGIKTEEYREIKPYWVKRLMEGNDFKHFDTVTFVYFVYGYTHRTMTFEVTGVTIGRGRKEWGAPEKDVFIIELGRRKRI